MDMNAKREIARNSAQVIHEQTHQYAVCLIDFETLEVASGTIVGIADRLFVITAAHVVPATPNGRLFMLGKHPHAFREGTPAFVAHHVDASKGRDVAFLEIEPMALGWLAKTPMSIKQVEDRVCGNPKMFTALTGFPSQTIADPVKSGQIVPKYTSIALLPIAESDYGTSVEPVPEGDAPADSQRDVFLNYREEDTRRLDTYEKIPLPAVGGMSGGGYFDFGDFNTGQIWSPTAMKLYAIQSSWNERPHNSYVRGTQIVYLIKLLADHYPDLRDGLRKQFPRVDDLT